MAVPRLPEQLGQISSPKQSHSAIQHEKDAVSREIIVSGSQHFIDPATSTVPIDSLNCQRVLRLALVNLVSSHESQSKTVLYNYGTDVKSQTINNFVLFR